MSLWGSLVLPYFSGFLYELMTRDNDSYSSALIVLPLDRNPSQTTVQTMSHETHRSTKLIESAHRNDVKFGIFIRDNHKKSPNQGGYA
jgi:hypothetical protein